MRSSHFPGSSAKAAPAIARASVNQLLSASPEDPWASAFPRSLLRILRIVLHVLGWLFGPCGRRRGSRFTSHEGREQITPRDRRGELAVGDDVVGQLGARYHQAASGVLRHDVAFRLAVDHVGGNDTG